MPLTRTDHAPIPQASAQPQRSAADDPEYRGDYLASEIVNALYALDHGWTGKGVLVGVLDDGVKPTLELDGQISSLSRDFGGTVRDGILSAHGNTGDERSVHGTMVATILAGKNDKRGVQGYAPEASIVSLRSDFHNEDTGFESIGYNADQALRYAADNGVLLVNRSLAKRKPEVANGAMQAAVAEYARRGGLVMNAAGNDGLANPADAIDLTSANAQGWLFVVAIDADSATYAISDYSNRCGTAMNRCVAGVGTHRTLDVENKAVVFTGTSAAAPQVTALAAAILSKWPQLSGVDAGNIILETARDIGDPGIDSVFGAGLIDYRAALEPIDPQLSNGKATVDLGGSAMIVPDAVGSDWNSDGAALGAVTVLDAYGREFSGDLSGLVVRPGRERGALARSVEARANAGYTGFAAGPLEASLGYTAFRTGPDRSDTQRRLTQADVSYAIDGALRITAGLRTQDSVIDEAAGLAPTSDAFQAIAPTARFSLGASRTLEKSRIAITLHSGKSEGSAVSGAVVRYDTKALTAKIGFVDEKGSVFGTLTGQGALRFGTGARTLFAEASRSLSAGEWRLDGYAGLGFTRLKLADDLLLTESSILTTGRFGVTASRPLLGGRLNVGIAQPLVVLSGSGRFTVASGYDLAHRGLVFEDRRVDFSSGMAPRFSIGFDRARAHSRFSFGASSGAGFGDVRSVVTWSLGIQ